MCAASGGGVNVVGGDVIRGVPSGSVTSTYDIDADGKERKNDSGSLAVFNTWLISGVASDCEVRATVSSGSTPTGSATGSWLALSADRSWSLTKSTSGLDSSTLLIEVRNKNSLVVLDSATVKLIVSVS